MTTEELRDFFPEHKASLKVREQIPAFNQQSICVENLYQILSRAPYE